MRRTKKKNGIGQYFTPPLIAEFMMEMVGFQPHWKVIDPACGEGIFLEMALKRGGVSVVGVDIDPAVLEEARARLSAYNPPPRLYNQDALLPIQDSNPFWQGEYDLVIGNPPYAARGYRIRDPAILRRFELSQEPLSNQSDSLFPDLPAYRKKSSVPIEVLFIERALQLARWGGTIALILPVGLMAGKQFYYLRKWLFSRYLLITIVELPAGVFHTEGTHARTVILYLIKAPAILERNVLLVNVEEIRSPLTVSLAESSQFKALAKVLQSEKEAIMEYCREENIFIPPS